VDWANANQNILNYVAISTGTSEDDFAKVNAVLDKVSSSPFLIVRSSPSIFSNLPLLSAPTGRYPHDLYGCGQWLFRALCNSSPEDEGGTSYSNYCSGQCGECPPVTKIYTDVMILLEHVLVVGDETTGHG